MQTRLSLSLVIVLIVSIALTGCARSTPACFPHAVIQHIGAAGPDFAQAGNVREFTIQNDIGDSFAVNVDRYPLANASKDGDTVSFCVDRDGLVTSFSQP